VAVRGNYENPSDDAKGEVSRADRNPWLAKMLTRKLLTMAQLIDDNRFIWILSSEDEMVCHTLSNLLHSLFEERSKQLKEL
jgi:hypothetical protein